MITGQTTSNTYQGDGSNRVWNISFEFTDSSQIKFKVNGQEVTTNFALNTVAKTLTYPTVASELDPLTSADEIEIYRDTNITQDIDFTNGGPLNAEMIEDGLDKLTMISQELKDKLVQESNLKILPNGTDIDSLKQEGEYLIVNATCTSGFPSDLPTTVERKGQVPPAGVTAYVRVLPTKTEATYPTVYLTQECLFYTYVNTPSTMSSFSSAYIRTMSSAEGFGVEFWNNFNVSNTKRAIGCGSNYGTPPTTYMPTKFYPNTDYFLGNFIKTSDVGDSSVVALYSLTLSDLPDSPYPITLYFKTANSFSGITATQIKAWIGSTSLDTNSGYKITITNLIGKIEKLTVVE